MSTELKAFKTQQLKKSNIRLKTKRYPKELVIVAEGDSWFDYPLKKDVIDYLRKKGFAVDNFAKAGDTLENMIYGSDYKIENGKIKHLGPTSLQNTLNAIKKHNPKFVLFSGGGNDIVGSEIKDYLNHHNSKPLSLVNKKIFKLKLEQVEIALKFFIEAVIKSRPKTFILMDGYDYAKVNGKGYSFIFRNIRGPWLQPLMATKGITTKNKQTEIIKYLVDEFNALLKRLDNKYAQFNHIDLRGEFPNDKEWDNEIHLKNNGFKKIANIYHAKMTELLNDDDPIEKYAEEIIV